MSTKAVLPIGAVIGLLAGALVYYFCFTGFGKVSPAAYQCATALYGACMAQSPERLDRVESIVSGDDTTLNPGQVNQGQVDDLPKNEEALSSKERVWLNQIIETARSGDWKSAAKSAKQMMNDQVEY